MKSLKPSIKHLKNKIYKIHYRNIIFYLHEINFGNVNLKKLIQLPSEIELYDFFLDNKNKYSKVCDIGANVGLHSIFLSKIFKSVSAYEPIKEHYFQLLENKKINKLKNISIIKKAVSLKSGKEMIIKLLSNTTASHLQISKRSKYGKIFKEEVSCVSIKRLLPKFDLIKLDIEGLEGDLIKSLNLDKKNPDFIIEVHNFQNAKKIYVKLKKNKYFKLIKLKKKKYTLIKKLKDMPTKSTEGSLLLIYDKKKTD